jgi:hypothetical protein
LPDTGIERDRRVPGEEGLVLLDVSEQGQGYQFGQRVAPERAFAVDQAADPSAGLGNDTANRPAGLTLARASTVDALAAQRGSFDSPA